MMHAMVAVLVLLTAMQAGEALADGRQALLAGYEKEALAAEPGFAGFSGARGEALFRGAFTTGKPDTPSCTTCHTRDPRQAGKTRAGKVIDPLAVSVSPQRFTDAGKVEKWFGRNCDSVLGRACTPLEKGDFITFMSAQ